MGQIYGRRSFMKGIAGLAGLGIIGCKDKKEKENIPPHISVLRNFMFGDGSAQYKLIGEDDSKVAEMQVRYNKGEVEYLQGAIHQFFKPASQRVNTLEAIAIDNQGARSSTDFEIIDTFEVPTREQATSQIYTILSNAGNWKALEYSPNQRQVIQIPGRPVEVDFKVIRNDNGISVIKYADIDEELGRNYSDMEILKDNGINSLYLIRTQVDSLKTFTQEFANNDYKDLIIFD